MTPLSLDKKYLFENFNYINLNQAKLKVELDEDNALNDQEESLVLQNDLNNQFSMLTNVIDCWLHINSQTSDIYFQNLTKLSLNNSKIGQITASTFAGLVNLRILRLSNNQLASVNAYTFDGLENLNELSLNGNKLTTIEDYSFICLKKLSKLWLNGNQLEEISDQAFYGLKCLVKLCLHNNNLRKLTGGSLSGLVNLEILSLHTNSLRKLKFEMFVVLFKLRFVSLYENKRARYVSFHDKSLYIHSDTMLKLDEFKCVHEFDKFLAQFSQLFKIRARFYESVRNLNNRISKRNDDLNQHSIDDMP
jgi:Leucine-rich repeat (LRR) protein